MGAYRVAARESVIGPLQSTFAVQTQICRARWETLELRRETAELDRCTQTKPLFDLKFCRARWEATEFRRETAESVCCNQEPMFKLKVCRARWEPTELRCETAEPARGI